MRETAEPAPQLTAEELLNSSRRWQVFDELERHRILVKGAGHNPHNCNSCWIDAYIAALRTQLEQAQADYEKARGYLTAAQNWGRRQAEELKAERRKFQNETLRTSELSRKLMEVVENLCPQHGPGSYGRHGCRYCGLLLEIEQLLAKPINVSAEPCDCTTGDTCTCADDCDCRERDAHIWKHDVGWRNIEGLQETRTYKAATEVGRWPKEIER